MAGRVLQIIQIAAVHLWHAEKPNMPVASLFYSKHGISLESQSTIRMKNSLFILNRRQNI